MSWRSCDDDREHRREAERDYSRGGRYGYDDQRYHGHGDCDVVYRDEFDRLRRDDERRQEERAEEERQERARDARHRAEADEARDWQEQQEADDHAAMQQPEPEPEAQP